MSILSTIFKPLTTATPAGVATRDLVVIVGSIIAVLGALGFLTPDQVAELTRQAPVLLTAIGTIMVAGMSLYRALFKSSSNKAAEVAKQVDKSIPKNVDVAISATTPASPAPHPGDIVGDIAGQIIGRVVKDAIIIQAKK